MKICTKCKIEQIEENFHFRKDRQSFVTICKECHRNNTKIWSDKNREYIRLRDKEHYKNNKEQIKENARNYYYENIEKVKERTSTEEHKTKLWEYNLKRLYNVDYKWYYNKLEEQNYKCAICEDDKNNVRFCIDHCHHTGMVGGLLCVNCNNAIGLLKHNIVILDKSIEYLKKYRKNANN